MRIGKSEKAAVSGEEGNKRKSRKAAACSNAKLHRHS